MSINIESESDDLRRLNLHVCGSFTDFVISIYNDYDTVMLKMDEFFEMNKIKADGSKSKYYAKLSKFMTVNIQSFSSELVEKYTLKSKDIYKKTNDCVKQKKNDSELVSIDELNVIKNKIKRGMTNTARASVRIIYKYFLLLDFDQPEMLNVNLSHFCSTTIDPSVDNSNYLDLENGNWTVNGMKILTCKEFTDYVKYEHGPRSKTNLTWLVGQSRTFLPYSESNTSSLSDMFTKGLGMTFTSLMATFRSHKLWLLSQEESNTQSELIDQSVPVVKNPHQELIDQSVHVVEIPKQMAKLRVIIKPINKMILKLCDINDELCRDVTNKIYMRNMKAICDLVSNQDEYLNGRDFCDSVYVIDKLNDFFNNPKKYRQSTSNMYSIETRLSYVKSLLKYLKLIKEFPSNSYLHYQRFFNELSTQNMVEKTKSNESKILDPDDFIKMKSKLEMYYNSDECKNINLKIIIKLLIEIDIEHNRYGVLRLGDLANTTLNHKTYPNYSYLNSETMEWHIIAECTKNNTQRTFKVSKGFVELVKEVRTGCDWLLCNDNLVKYENAKYLSQVFIDHLHMTYFDIRRQFVTYLHKYSTMSIINEIAINMGHSAMTAMLEYNKSE